jgi:hypothetical protein
VHDYQRNELNVSKRSNRLDTSETVCAVSWMLSLLGRAPAKHFMKKEETDKSSAVRELPATFTTSKVLETYFESSASIFVGYGWEAAIIITCTSGLC